MHKEKKIDTVNIHMFKSQLKESLEKNQFLMVNIHEKEGNPKVARSYLIKIVEANPSHKRAVEMLESILAKVPGQKQC